MCYCPNFHHLYSFPLPCPPLPSEFLLFLLLSPLSSLSSPLFLHIYLKVKVKSLVVSDSLRPHGLQPTRRLHSWDFPGKSTGVGCHFLFWEIFPTQGLNPGLLHCTQMLYRLSHQGSLTLNFKYFSHFILKNYSKSSLFTLLPLISYHYQVSTKQVSLPQSIQKETNEHRGPII